MNISINNIKFINCLQSDNNGFKKISFIADFLLTFYQFEILIIFSQKNQSLIIEEYEYGGQFQLDDQGVKLLCLMLIKASDYYRPFFRSLSINIQKRKIIPFFLENFVKFLKGKQFCAQQQYMEDILKTRRSLKYRCQDLTKIFMNSENVEIQLKWIDYLEGFAAIDIQRKIDSKKIQNIYLQNLKKLQQQINQPRPYYCFMKSNKIYIPQENELEFYNPPLSLMDSSQIFLNGLKRKNKMIIK
ncbi:hypothetical protein pb186bvf_009415 [Paramecium bursaria]